MWLSNVAVHLTLAGGGVSLKLRPLKASWATSNESVAQAVGQLSGEPWLDGTDLAASSNSLVAASPRSVRTLDGPGLPRSETDRRRGGRRSSRNRARARPCADRCRVNRNH